MFDETQKSKIELTSMRRERDRQTDRQTDRDRDRQTDRDRDRERQRATESDRDRDGERHPETERQRARQRQRQRERQRHRDTERDTGVRADTLTRGPSTPTPLSPASLDSTAKQKVAPRSLQSARFVSVSLSSPYTTPKWLHRF